MEESPTAGPNLGLAYLSLLYAVVVMANLQALLAVETGTLTPPRWQLEVRRCRPHCNRFEAQVLLARYLAQPPMIWHVIWTPPMDRSALTRSIRGRDVCCSKV